MIPEPMTASPAGILPAPSGSPAPPSTLADVRVLVTLGGSLFYGQERGNVQVFHALRDVGVDALFLTHRDKGHIEVQPALDRMDLAWTTAPYPSRWRYGMSPRRLAREVRRTYASNRDFRQAFRRYRPTHVHTMSERYALDLAPSLRRLSVPLIYRAGDVPLQHNLLYRSLWRRLLIPKVSQFVAISQFVRRSLRDVGVPDDRIRVIYNYPPDRPASNGTSDLPPDLLAPYVGRTVLYMGQMTRDKGVDLLVEAALAICRERDDVRFLFAGASAASDELVNQLTRDVRAAGFAERVRFVGYVQDIPGLLDLADVHTAPSVWDEPLSNVVGEAKRAGVPSVIFRSGGLPELVVEDGRDAVLCRAKTAEALASGLRHYLDAPSETLQAAGAAARHSLSVLGITRDAFTQKWAAVYSAPPTHAD